MSSRESKSVEPLVELLTRREREVLALLSQGLTAPEIAEKLTLAVSSVKYHIQHVYGKLGVNSKRQALNRARELGLLGVSQPQADTSASPVEPETHDYAPTLPLQVTRFFGREDEIADLKQRLADHRLVTLVGSGGIGKTRLALQVAEALAQDFADGVWFVELAPLADSALVPQQVAAALRLRDEPGRQIVDMLLHQLRPRQVLLVLDNCEHLLNACAHLAGALLQSCPHLKILATSREPLGTAGEAIFAIPSLPFPSAEAVTVERLPDYTAVRLFVDRARLVLPKYEVSAENAPAIVRICQRLDGVPLALEMAAARMASLTTQQLADRLHESFRLLTSGSRTALPRQQTLRATLDWSYQLLDPEQRLLLQRLSVFAGDCTLDAAEAVCSGYGLEAGSVLDVLAALVAKSLVTADRQPGEALRYRLLETVRQYAREKLQEAGETARLYRRHQDYFLTFAETNFPKLETDEQNLWLPKLEAELANFRLALEWTLRDRSEVESAVRLLIIMRGFLFRHEEALDWRMRTLALCQGSADISARLHAELLGQTSNFVALNEPQFALSLAAQSVEISRALGPEGREMLMWRLLNLANRFIDCGDADQAAAPLAEAEALLGALGPDRYAPEEGSRVKAAFAYFNALLANQQGRYLDAKAYAAEHIRLGDALGSHFLVVNGQTNMGEACLHLGDYQGAREHLLAAIAPISEIEGGVEVSPHALMWLGLVDFRQGNLERAREYCLESIRQADETPDRNIIASNLGVMAAICAMQGHSDRAARLAGASVAMWARQKRKPWEFSSPDTLLPGWRDGPEAAVIQQAYDAGQAMSSDEAVAYALKDETT